MNKILIVENEIAIVDLIRIGLQSSGYEFEYALDGKRGADLLEQKQYDLVLLDIMLPEIDGYELLEYIKPMGIPIIFITAKGQVKDKIKGLQMGADDYIVKPFETEELLARIEAVLRRYHKGGKQIVMEDIRIDLNSRTVKRKEKWIELTPKEFELLVMLAQNRNTALYREDILERIWGIDMEIETRTLDIHIQRLRKKLGWKEQIKTVYKIGYRLEVRE